MTGFNKMKEMKLNTSINSNVNVLEERDGRMYFNGVNFMENGKDHIFDFANLILMCGIMKSVNFLNREAVLFYQIGRCEITMSIYYGLMVVVRVTTHKKKNYLTRNTSDEICYFFDNKKDFKKIEEIFNFSISSFFMESYMGMIGESNDSSS